MHVARRSRLATAAAAAARVHAPAACSSSLAPTSRLLSSYVNPRDTAEAKRRKRQSNFWRQWGERSQQEFWQDVGLNNDRANDEKKSVAVKAKSASPKKEDKYEDRTKYDEDEYWHTIDAFDEFGDGLDALDEIGSKVDAHYFGTSDLSTRAANERAIRARAALLRDGDVTPSRRAELMMLLEDVGPDGLLPPPPMPREDFIKEKELEEFKMQQDLSRMLVTARDYAAGAMRATPRHHEP